MTDKKDLLVSLPSDIYDRVSKMKADTGVPKNRIVEDALQAYFRDGVQ